MERRTPSPASRAQLDLPALAQRPTFWDNIESLSAAPGASRAPFQPAAFILMDRELTTGLAALVNGATNAEAPAQPQSQTGMPHVSPILRDVGIPKAGQSEQTSAQSTGQPAPVSAASPLRGSVLVLIQFDVCEEIRLDVLRKIFGARTAEASFKHQAPGYVRYQRPPVEESLDPLILDSGERLEGTIKYYDYGVVSLVFELPFSGGWDTLVQLSSRWTSDTNFEALASRVVRQKLELAAPALVKPYDVKPYDSKPDTADWLQEDYFIFHVQEVYGAPSANDLLAAQGDHIAQVVRGETSTLSDGERQEILQSRISYYPNDLAVIGWNAAFIYDIPPAPRPRSSFCNTPTRSC